MNRFPTRFLPCSCSSTSSASNRPISNVSPVAFMISSSIPPTVVTIACGTSSWITCAKNPRRPDVTMLDVKVRNTLAFARFIRTIVSAARASSVLWYPTCWYCRTRSCTVIPSVHLKSLTFIIFTGGW